MRRNLVLCATSLFLAAVPVLAHHSFAAEYDATKSVTLTGVVTKVEWTNPHIWFYLSATDETGKAATWQCEGGAPNSLVRNGWSKNSLKEGDKVTVEGYRAKDATATCNSRSVTLADGKRVFSGSADDGGPNARGGARQKQ